MSAQDNPQPKAIAAKRSVNRPAQAADSERVIKRRARRACLSCRARKVRCDVIFQESPCTNCKLDGLDCVVKPRSRKWPGTQAPVQEFIHQNRQQQTVPLPPFSCATTPSLLHLLPAKPGLKSGLQDGDAPLEAVGLAPGPDMPLGPDPNAETTASETPLREDSTNSETPSIAGILANVAPSPVHDDDAPSESSSSVQRLPCIALSDRLTESFVLFSCYAFVEADSLQLLSPKDVSFLEQRGCLHLPARQVLDDFLKQYFSYVHPILPLLNEANFWSLSSPQLPPSSEQRRISLFILQSMLFISCPYVPLSILCTLGFHSVRQARVEFYSKAKALFDIDTYRDDFSSAQGALMLTYHTSTATDRINTYWLSTAIHFARGARADQYSTIDETPEHKNLLKRLWWCCILRDRIMALGLRRPMVIRPSDFNFTEMGLVENDFNDEIRGSKIYNAATKRVLVQLAVSLCELGVILNGVLENIYPVNVASKLVHGQQHQETSRSCSTALEYWYEKTVAKFLIPTQIIGAHQSLILFTDIVYMYHFTAKAAICNQMMLLSITDLSVGMEENDDRLQTQEELSRSVRNMTDIIVELQQLGLSKYLPNTLSISPVTLQKARQLILSSITFSAFPFIWCILDMIVVGTSCQSDILRQDLETYTDVMKGFGTLYESTDSVLECIEKIVDYIKVNELQEPLHTRWPEADLTSQDSFATSQKLRCPHGSAWADLLYGDPQSYFRITLTVESSLSRGQFSSGHDISESLQAFPRRDGYFTSYKALTNLGDTAFCQLLEQAFDAGKGA